MTGYNLPPGCNVSDLPGNRPEDVAWERFWESDTIFELYHEYHNKKTDDINVIEKSFDDDKEFQTLVFKTFETIYFGDELEHGG